MGKLWKLVFGYIDIRALRLAYPENAISQTYCTSYVDVRTRHGSQFSSYPRQTLLAARKILLNFIKDKTSMFSRASLLLLKFGGPRCCFGLHFSAAESTWPGHVEQVGSAAPAQRSVNLQYTAVQPGTQPVLKPPLGLPRREIPSSQPRFAI
jgi:hypothetical protein